MSKKIVFNKILLIKVHLWINVIVIFKNNKKQNLKMKKMMYNNSNKVKN